MEFLVQLEALQELDLARNKLTGKQSVVIVCLALFCLRERVLKLKGRAEETTSIVQGVRRHDLSC